MSGETRGRRERIEDKCARCRNKGQPPARAEPGKRKSEKASEEKIARQEVRSKAWDREMERGGSHESMGELGDIGRATLDSRRQGRKESRMQGAGGLHLTLLFYLRIQIVNAERGRTTEGSGT